MKTGILLINLGTPRSPSVKDVRKYLREFLMDEEVIDINPFGRWLLVNLVIAPFRGPKSAKLYREIWTKEGSPLLVHGKKLVAKLMAQCGEKYSVALGMRYQRPSIGEALETLIADRIEKLIVVPLYPQYASSTTGSTITRLNEEIAAMGFKGEVKIIEKFHSHPAYLQAVAGTSKPFNIAEYDHVLFSFHGVPERHITKTDRKLGDGKCSFGDCCVNEREGNYYCYRANCVKTAHALAGNLQLDQSAYSISFQSRLGRDPWLQPYTDATIEQLAKNGKKKILVFCPAFVADCLETIHEIAHEYSEKFRQCGGGKLNLVPSLNSNDDWVDALATIIREAE